MSRYRLWSSTAQVPVFNDIGAEVFLSYPGYIPGDDGDGGGENPEPPPIKNPVTGSIAPYAMEPETDALVAAMSNQPPEIHVRHINEAIKKIKRADAWSKIKMLSILGLDDQQTRIHWNNPSVSMSKIGNPEFVAKQGFRATATGQALDTKISPIGIPQNDVFHAVWCQGTDANGNTLPSANMEYGRVDSAGKGISLVIRTSQNSTLARTNGDEVIVAPAGHSDGYGLRGARRKDSAGSVGLKNGIPMPKATDVSSLPASGNITALAATVNGALVENYSPNTQAAWVFAEGLTDKQIRVVTGAISTYLDALQYGQIDEWPTGLGQEVVTADVICYGTTPQSIAAAIQASRAGASVAVIGGWRDRRLGGMSTGGLGETDYFAPDYLQGLASWMFQRARSIAGFGSNGIVFIPRMMSRAIRELMCPSTNGGYDIPVYYGKGVSEVTKEGNRIVSFVTVDGRRVNGKHFIDGSYEGDLMMAAGIPYRIGREAYGSGVEAIGGYRGVTANNGGGHKQFRNRGGQEVEVDPWKIPGVPSSGLLDQITGIYSDYSPDLHDQPPLTSADDELQAYCYRLCYGSDSARRVDLPSQPPATWPKERYEMLFRFLELAPTVRFQDRWKVDPVGSGVHDLNTGHGMGSDFIGASKEYPLATYERREEIWKDHTAYTLGLWNVYQYADDPRVPAALRNEFLNWGPRSDHYHDPHENDDVFETPQLYVREAVRMIGLASADGNTLNQPDGQTPMLGIKTAAVAAYSYDHHGVTRIAYEKEPGHWMIWVEGGWIRPQGNTNKMNPVPMEILVPKREDCINLSVTFAASLTTVAFGSFRMEATAIQAGQTMGQAAAQAIIDDTSIQDVNYESVRSAMMVDNAIRMPGEPAPSLPQTT